MEICDVNRAYANRTTNDFLKSEIFLGNMEQHMLGSHNQWLVYYLKTYRKLEDVLCSTLELSSVEYMILIEDATWYTHTYMASVHAGTMT